VDPNDVFNYSPRPNASQVAVINGVVMPSYSLDSKEIQQWRFIHAGKGSFAGCKRSLRDPSLRQSCHPVPTGHS
jgi:hypothetical protein